MKPYFFDENMVKTDLPEEVFEKFTMNKEVEVTGLNMTATSSKSIELSLGAVSYDANSATKLKVEQTDTVPLDTETEMSWAQAITFGDYYISSGRLRPSSSISGNDNTFFEADDPSAGGVRATKFTASTDAAALNKETEYLSTPGALTSLDETQAANTGTDGIYIDIPIYLRTNEVAANAGDSKTVFCKMVINDNKTDKTEELYKAVRVAFIPTANANTRLNSGDTMTALTETEARTKSIWAASDTYYADYGYGSGAVASVNAATKVGSKLTVSPTINTESVFELETASGYNASTGTTTGMSIPLASKSGEYGHLAFIARIWLEGESTYCLDANAKQDWNISFAFALDNGEGAGDFNVESGG